MMPGDCKEPPDGEDVVTATLKDKVAIVTGSGRGVGRGIAMLMAQEGAKVVVNDLGAAMDGSGSDTSVAERTAQEIRTQGGQAVHNCDSVASYQGAASLVKTALDAFGRLDILINNAGILRDRMFFNMSEEEWDAVIAVHLKGNFGCSRAAVAAFQAQKSGGRIINMTSTAGLYGNTGQANYCSAKDGIAGFTRALASELKPQGITVNAIAPTGRTRLTDTITSAVTAVKAAAGIDRAAEQAKKVIPEAEDVAPFAIYLCSDAGASITGQVFHVSGGTVTLLKQPEAICSIWRKDGWTSERIAAAFPRTLGMGMVNPAPAQQPRPA